MKQIAIKNDTIRRQIPCIHEPHRLILTASVAPLPQAELDELITAAREFDAFTKDNDPYGEHDVGIVTVNEQVYLWKLDCYDDDFEFYKEDGNRVLTIMASHEY